MNSKENSGYLRHIDGIRAIAVLVVIAYHLDVRALPGGYVGVDVFFVISGFLITRLILGELERSVSFSFKNFYLRRIRRLMPALFVTLAGSWVLFAFLFPPNRLQEFAESMVAAIFSVSNIFFWSVSGYFDSDAAAKPLLHTWSLGVEEQFYMFWPFFLYAVYRLSRHVFAIVALLGLVSFGANFYGLLPGVSAEYDSAIFFNMPFRIFEFALGALCIPLLRHMPESRFFHDIVSVFGLLLILAASAWFDGSIAFPSHYALLPCAGAMLMIVACRTRMMALLLQSRPVVYVGLISYSLYLVHWPLIVAWKYYFLRPLGPVEALLLFGLMVAISAAIFRYVEQPMRLPSMKHRPQHAPRAGFLLRPVMISAALLVGGGLYALGSSGMQWRFPDAITAEEYREEMRKRLAGISETCRIDRLDDSENCKPGVHKRILVIGDSHAPDGLNTLQSIYRDDPEVELVYFGSTNLCEIDFTEGVPVSKVKALNCRVRTDNLARPEFLETIDAVFLSANRPFSAGKQHLWRILAYIHQVNPEIKFAVRGGFINLSHDCAELYNRFGSVDACRLHRFAAYSAASEWPDGQPPVPVDFEFSYIDIFGALCENRELSACAISTGEKPAFYDKHHFTYDFSRLVAERLRYSLKQALTGGTVN